MLHRFRRYLLLDESRQMPISETLWRISTLRVLAFSSLLLIAFILTHCIYQALWADRLSVLWVEGGFLLAFISLFCFGKHSYRIARVVLVSVFYALGLCSLFFVDYEQAKAGILILYATPLLALLFFNWRIYLAFCAFNLLPLYLILSNTALPHPFGFDLSLRYTRNYLHLLLFTVFNLCIPLAVARLIATLTYTQQHQTQLNKALLDSQHLYNEIFSHLGAFLLCRRDGLILKLNQEAAALLNASSETLEGQLYLGDLLHNEHGHPVRLVADDALQEWQTRGRGKPRRLNLRISQPTENQNVLVKLRDITHLHALQNELRHSERLNIQDPLVGVLNRSGAVKRLEQAIILAQGQPLAALTIQLPHLTYINTKYGLEIGDRYLQSFAHHLNSLPRNNLIARLKGSTFLVVLTGLDRLEDALICLERVQQDLPDHMVIDQHRIDVIPNVGIAFYPQDATSALELIERSNQALKNAQTGTAWQVYDPQLARRSFERTDLLLKLQQAIKAGDLFLHYQPRVNRSGCLHSVEALVRWTMPDGRSIPPDQFVTIAEESGLIYELDACVREKACAQIAAWKHRFGKAPLVAVNLSAQEVASPELLDNLNRCLERHGLSSTDLELEITESSLLQKSTITQATLKALTAHGFKLTMDDFGTGYSSLSQLTQLPISSLKIDRSFLKNVPGSERQETLIKTLLTLARLMELHVVAEGVETLEQFRLLKALGCDLYQGYLFSRPLDADSLTERYLVNSNLVE